MARPAGSKNKATLEREAREEAERVEAQQAEEQEGLQQPASQGSESTATQAAPNPPVHQPAVQTPSRQNENTKGGQSTTRVPMKRAKKGDDEGTPVSGNIKRVRVNDDLRTPLNHMSKDEERLGHSAENWMRREGDDFINRAPRNVLQAYARVTMKRSDPFFMLRHWEHEWKYPWSALAMEYWKSQEEPHVPSLREAISNSHVCGFGEEAYNLMAKKVMDDAVNLRVAGNLPSVEDDSTPLSVLPPIGSIPWSVLRELEERFRQAFPFECYQHDWLSQKCISEVYTNRRSKHNNYRKDVKQEQGDAGVGTSKKTGKNSKQQQKEGSTEQSNGGGDSSQSHGANGEKLDGQEADQTQGQKKKDKGKGKGKEPSHD